MHSRIVFNYYVKGVNTGDTVCSPLDYYNIPYAHKFDLLTSDRHMIKKAIWLFGGGGILHFENLFKRLLKGDNKVVGWGIGFNVHTRKFYTPHDFELLRHFDLVGLRDFGVDIPGTFNVPCVSCKHSAFDKVYEIEDDVRVYEHMNYPVALLPHVPRSMNLVTRHSFAEVIKFIGGCSRLITTSYHGAYWGALMGRQVYIYKPFSTKFRNMPHTRVIPEDGSLWRVEVNQNFLQECRDKNDEFFDLFMLRRAEWEAEG